VKGSGLPVKPMVQLKEEAEPTYDIPQKPRFTDKLVAAIKWVDGTVIDVVRQVEEERL